MSATSLESRVARLEAEVQRLRQEQALVARSRKPWWEEIRGTFKNDPAYEEAMELGRRCREEQHPESEPEREA